MKALGLLRAIFSLAALGVGLSLTVGNVVGQDVGADIGGGAGIFRPKNPEARKKTTRTTTGSKPANRNTARIEELLDSGNNFRDARRFAEAEGAYQGVLKLSPNDARAAYGLGNVYSDQQRWDEADAAYRNAVLWAATTRNVLPTQRLSLVGPCK
jgi:tetratricopeptide (TPR) repeat protein